MKTHLLSSDDPLVEHADFEAACGTMVKKAEFRFFFNDGELPARILEAISSINTCRKCLEENLIGKYVYGIAEGDRDMNISGG